MYKENIRKHKKKLAGFVFALVVFIMYSAIGFSSAYLTDTSGATFTASAGSIDIERVDVVNDVVIPTEIIAEERYTLSLAFKNTGDVNADLHLNIISIADGVNSSKLIEQIEVYYEDELLTENREIIINNIDTQEFRRIEIEFLFVSDEGNQLLDLETLGLKIISQFKLNNSSWSSNTIESTFKTKFNGSTELFLYSLTDNGYTITGFNEVYIEKNLDDIKPNRITIPNSYNGQEVTSIGDNAFLNQSLNSVILPSSIKIIGGNAFKSNNLDKIVIPDSVNLIKPFAFDHNNKGLLLTANIIYNNDTDNSIRGWNIINEAKRTTLSTHNRKFLLGSNNWTRWGNKTTNTLKDSTILGRKVMNIKSTGTGNKQYNGILQKLDSYRKGQKYRVVVTARRVSGNSELETIVWTQPGTNGKEPQFNKVFNLTNEYQTFYYEFIPSNRANDKDMILHLGGIGTAYEIDIAEAYLEYIGTNPISPSVGVPNSANKLETINEYENYRLPGTNRLVEPLKTEENENEEQVESDIAEEEEIEPVIAEEEEEIEPVIDEDEKELIPDDEIILPPEEDETKPEDLESEVEPDIDKRDDLVNPEETKNGMNDELNNDTEGTG